MKPTDRRWAIFGMTCLAVIAAAAVSGCSGGSSRDTQQMPTLPDLTVTPQPSSAATPTPAASAPGSSAGNPASPCTIIDVSDPNYIPPFSAEVEVIGVDMGDRAYEELQWRDMDGVPALPDAGMEYALVTVRFRLTGVNSDDNSLLLTSLDFVAVAGNDSYQADPGVIPGSSGMDIDGRLSPGDGVYGWIVYQVPEGSAAPLVVFDRDTYTGSAGCWFRTA